MKNIIFISLPKIETLFPSAALAILASVARDNNFKVNIFDYNLILFQQLLDHEWSELESWCSFSSDIMSDSLEQKLKKEYFNYLTSIINENTKFICISVFSYFSNRIAEKTLKWTKEKFNIPIIIGGSGISTDVSKSNTEIFGEYIVKNHLADYVIFGEGEHALAHLLSKNFVMFPGINKNNPIQINDLSLLPIPTYDDFDLTQYRQKRMLITGSRGCVKSCTFCDVSNTWPNFKYRKAEHIVDEIKHHFYKYGGTEFEFTDSLINGSISNFNRFNEILYNEKQKNPELLPITYQGQFVIRSDSKQLEESYELMHLGGCNMLTVGVESFSVDVRHHMKKKFSNEDLDLHFDRCARWKIPNVILMLVGYPTETQKDHQANLDALIKYKKFSDMCVIFMIRWGYTMHLYNHTPIMNMLDELQIKIDNHVKFDSVYSWSTGINLENTLPVRILRRLEIHEQAVKLGYVMPRVKEELFILKKLAEACYINRPL